MDVCHFQGSTGHYIKVWKLSVAVEGDVSRNLNQGNRGKKGWPIADNSSKKSQGDSPGIRETQGAFNQDDNAQKVSVSIGKVFFLPPFAPST